MNQASQDKIREGPIFKRSGILKEWEDRWMVLTMGAILLYANKSGTVPLEQIDLKDIKSYKSYVQKGQDMLPAGFKIRSEDDMFYLCARSLNEKWSWLVTFERLMDFKVAGKSPYNGPDEITTRGFVSQKEFESGMQFYPAPGTQKVGATPPTPDSPTRNKAREDEEANRMAKNLLEKEERLKAREAQLRQREEEVERSLKQQETVFIQEMTSVKQLYDQQRSKEQGYLEIIAQLEAMLQPGTGSAERESQIKVGKVRVSVPQDIVLKSGGALQAEQAPEEKQLNKVPAMDKSKAVHLASTYLGFDVPISMEPHLKLTHDNHQKLRPIQSEAKVAAAQPVVPQTQSAAASQPSKPVKIKPFPVIPKSEQGDLLAGMAFVGFSVVPSKEKELFAEPKPVGKKPSRNLLIAQTYLGMALPMTFEKNVVIKREKKKPSKEAEVKAQVPKESKPAVAVEAKQKLPHLIRNANKSTAFIQTLLGFNVPLQLEPHLKIDIKPSIGQKQLTSKAMGSDHTPVVQPQQLQPEEVRPNRESTEAFLAEMQKNEEARAQAIANETKAQLQTKGPEIKKTKEQILPDNNRTPQPQQEEQDILDHDDAMLASATTAQASVQLTSSAVSAPAGVAEETSIDRTESSVSALKSMYESKNKQVQESKLKDFKPKPSNKHAQSPASPSKVYLPVKKSAVPKERHVPLVESYLGLILPLSAIPNISLDPPQAHQEEEEEKYNVATEFEYEDGTIPERGRGVSRVEEIKNIYESKIKGEDLSKTEKGTSATEAESPQRTRGESKVSDLKKMYESMANKK